MVKIVGIVFLNASAVTYSVVNGFKVDILSFQILLGMSFGLMGYVGTFWTFGLPIGSLIANFKVNQTNKNIDIIEIDDNE